MLVMLMATPASHGHRPPLCTMVYNSDRGAQCRSVVRSTVEVVHNIGHTNPDVQIVRHTENDAYENTMQIRAIYRLLHPTFLTKQDIPYVQNVILKNDVILV